MLLAARQAICDERKLLTAFRPNSYTRIIAATPLAPLVKEISVGN